MSKCTRYARLAVFVGAIAACGSPSNPDSSPEAGPDVTDPHVDAAVDASDLASDAPADASTMFGPCTTTADCTGPQATCIRVGQGYPLGQCTRRCTSSTQCGDQGSCLPFRGMNLCFQTCSFGIDCRPGYNCFTYSNDATMQLCFPLCSTDAQCPGAHCNVYTGFCEPTDLSLADNGAPCTANGDCRSNRCLTEIDAMGRPSGYLDGYCITLCTIPPDDQFAGTMLPRGPCPAGQVVERPSTRAAGDLGYCDPECTVDTDCRGGYVCIHPTRLGATGRYTNGYCERMNCHYMMQTCPPNAVCATTATDGGVPVNGVCTHADGGVGDAADAPSADGSDVIDASDTQNLDAADASVLDIAVPDIGSGA